MKNKAILFSIIFFIIAGLFVFIKPAKVETNLARGIFAGVFSKNTAKKLSLRYSSEINIIFESSNPEDLQDAKADFFKSLDNETFKIRRIEPAHFLESYNLYNKNLLSNQAYNLLKQEDYAGIAADAYFRLFDITASTEVSLNNDPFMLYSDYLKSINTDKEIVKYEGKYYDTINLDIKKDKNLSTKDLNEKIKNLIYLQDEISNENTKIYSTGIPISSYYENLKSGIQIKLIYLLSALFIILLFYFYLRNLSSSIPIFITLGLGFLSGYFVCNLIFARAIHTFTFLYSGALIGFSLSYIFPFIIEKENNNLIKNTILMLCITIFSCILLLFAQIEIIKQISIFTIFWLLGVCTVLVIIYPYINFKVSRRKFHITPQNKYQRIVIITLTVLIGCGMYFAKFSDNIQDFYYPTKKLLQTQELFRNISGDDVKTSFIVVKGNDLQDLLEKEEEITQNIKNVEYQSISKYVPSIKRQRENFLLRKKLYKNYLKSYATFISDEDENKLINESEPTNFLTTEDEDFLSEFLIDKNTSIIILYNFDNPNIIKDGKYINLQKDLSTKIGKIRKGYEHILIPFFVFLFIILAFCYKPKNATKILTPVILSAGFTLGILSLAQVQLNIFHITSLFLAISMGLEYSIYKVNTNYNKETLFLSYVTKAFSSLLLSLTTFKPINSIGIVLFIGLTMSYIISNTINNEETT